jgi:hypothetical protein
MRLDEAPVRDAVRIRKDEVWRSRNSNGLIQNPALAKAIIRLIDAADWKGRGSGELVKEFGHLRPGAVIGNDHFEIAEGLPRIARQHQPEFTNRVVDSNDDRRAAHWCALSGQSGLLPVVQDFWMEIL